VRGALLAFALGIGLLQQARALPAWPGPGTCIALLVVVAGALAVAHRGKHPGTRLLACAVAVAAAAAMGYAWASWRAQIRLADELPGAWEGKDLALIGLVDEMPQPGGDGSQRFVFAVESVISAQAMVPSRLSLAWYPLRGRDGDLAPPEIHAGERWRLLVRLRRPHGNANPAGFDLEAWMLEQNLRASGYVRSDSGNARLDAFAGRPKDYLERAREALRLRMLKALEGRPYAGVIVALAIGDQRAIPDAQWRLFNRTGIGHLISISGLHVTLFASLMGGLCYLLWRQSQRLTSLLPARKAAALTGVLAAAAYVLLAGYQVPAQRTLYMLGVAAAGLWIGRPGTGSAVLLWALAAVLAIDPWAVLAPGFWLSFGAVALLFYVGSARTGRPHWLAAALETQWAVTLGLLPPMLGLFQQVSLVSPLANAFAIPVVSFVVVPLTLFALVLPLDAPLVAAHAVFELVAQALAALSALPAAVWEQHAPAWWAVAAGAFGTLLLLAPRGIPGRWLGALWLLPLFLIRPAAPPAGMAWITVLDVGQGLSLLVRTSEHALLYDTGPRFSLDADAGNRIIAPYLRAAGVPRLDALVVSHQDSDHSGGARSLMQVLPIGWLLSSLPQGHELLRDAEEQAITHLRCEAGQGWEWDGVRFSVLHPAGASYDNPKLKTNDRGCVLKIADATGSLLIAADIEARSERELVARESGALPAGALLVPHHGSKTSSTPEFIDAVSPTLAIVTAGYRNRFGHPKPEIVERYSNRGIRVLRTDDEGAIELRLNSEGPRAQGYRARDRHYWREAPQPERAQPGESER